MYGSAFSAELEVSILTLSCVFVSDGSLEASAFLDVWWCIDWACHLPSCNHCPFVLIFGCLIVAKLYEYERLVISFWTVQESTISFSRHLVVGTCFILLSSLATLLPSIEGFVCKRRSLDVTRALHQCSSASLLRLSEATFVGSPFFCFFFGLVCVCFFNFLLFFVILFFLALLLRLTCLLTGLVGGARLWLGHWRECQDWLVPSPEGEGNLLGSQFFPLSCLAGGKVPFLSCREDSIQSALEQLDYSWPMLFGWNSCSKNPLVLKFLYFVTCVMLWVMAGTSTFSADRSRNRASLESTFQKGSAYSIGISIWSIVVVHVVRTGLRLVKRVLPLVMPGHCCRPWETKCLSGDRHWKVSDCAQDAYVGLRLF